MSDETRVDAIRSGRCPECGCAEMIAGPWGCASRNILCPTCLTRWNAHGVAYGVLAVDMVGPCTLADLEHAHETYREHWTGTEQAPRTQRSELSKMTYTEVERRHILQYWQRKETATKIEKIDNASLPAGSPMTYYCRFCGTFIATLPELHREAAPTVCGPCRRLDGWGLMPPPTLEELQDGQSPP